MSARDGIMDRIGAAIALSRAGDRAAAIDAFGRLWSETELEPAADPFHRCVLAHYMADVQEDVRDELSWDLRALDAAAAVTDARVAQAGLPGGARGLYPSLHLNLGLCYHALGDLRRAAEHAELGLASADALGDEEYGRMIKAGLEQLAEQVRPA